MGCSGKPVVDHTGCIMGFLREEQKVGQRKSSADLRREKNGEIEG